MTILQTLYLMIGPLGGLLIAGFLVWMDREPAPKAPEHPAE